MNEKIEIFSTGGISPTLPPVAGGGGDRMTQRKQKHREPSRDENAMAGEGPASSSVYADVDAHAVCHAFHQAVYSLTPGREAGSHTMIFALDPQRLSAVLTEMVRSREGEETAARRAPAIDAWCRDFCRRFLFKVGRTDNFTMRLGSSKPLEIPRAMVSEVFGGIGYSLFPTWRKTHSDSLEAAREIPYFFHGNPRDLFLFPVDDVVRDLLAGRPVLPLAGDPSGIFLIAHTAMRRERLSLYDLLASDPYAREPVADEDAFVQRMRRLREEPLSEDVVRHLQGFFDAPITVGVRDALRWLNGARHPEIGWKEAREIVEACFARHRHEDFLLPELNYYVRDPALSPEAVARTDEANREVIQAAAARLRRFASARLRRLLGMEDMERLMGLVLAWHHGYPQYRLEETVGVLNHATLKVGLKFAEQLALLLSDVKMPVRRNADLQAFLQSPAIRSLWGEELLESDWRELQALLAQFLLFYDLRHGVPTSRGMREYRFVPTTFVTFQERADFLPPGAEKIVQFSLEQLAKAEYSIYLRRYPELAEKLVVFFVLVLRFFLDTDFVPDLRPDEAGIHIFILGIWGYITENLIITLYRDADGMERFRIKFVDNKDHFKQYKREVDRNRPLGLAKHGLRIVQPVVLPAMLRAVGNFVQIVHENRMGVRRREISLTGLVEYGMAVAQEVILKGIDYSADSLQALIADGLDDAGKLAGRIVRWTASGSPEEPPPEDSSSPDIF